MKSRTDCKNRDQKRVGVSALAIGCAIAFAIGPAVNVFSVDPAFAQSGGHSGGTGGPSGGTDHSDDHSHDDSGQKGKMKGKPVGGESGGHSGGGHDDGGHDDGGHDDGSGGRGGAGETSGGSGARFGQQTDGTHGRPPWAREGIPEIELGRLNVARSPSHVLDRAFLEALSNFTADKVAFYNMSIEDAAAALRTDFQNVAMIDSPLQNLSLLRDILEDGNSVLNTLDQVDNDTLTLAAIFLGTASDKSIKIVPESAYALSIILGYELSQAQATALAHDAEIIRAAIQEGHG